MSAKLNRWHLEVTAVDSVAAAVVAVVAVDLVAVTAADVAIVTKTTKENDNRVFTFQDERIPSGLKRALTVMDFSQPTPIQEKVIPEILAMHDLVGSAQTGTGKTAAFCIPMIMRMESDPQIQGLILVPTRELAQQVIDVWAELTRFLPKLRAALLIGGAPMFRQVRELSSGPRLIVATPGRLIDHIEQRTVQLNRRNFLVLDEADRMLDMGFAPQISRIASHLPSQRQTLLFSATWDKDVQNVSRKYLRNPKSISIGQPSRASGTVNQEILETTPQMKNSVLVQELKNREGLILVFARTKARTDRLTRFVQKSGGAAKSIHGGRSQSQRQSALMAFKTGKIRILIATDIAARGIDVENISHVINYDLPRTAEDYVHRIGRTGRAGLSGRALSFLTPEDAQQWRMISTSLKRSDSSWRVQRSGN